MALLPSQINRLERDMNELRFKIRRCEQQDNVIRAERLKVKLSYVEDAIEELRTYQKIA